VSTKQRLDQLVLERGLAPSRERARALILAGKVMVGDHTADKAGQLVPADAAVRLREPDHPYVSRGGLKLQAALTELHIDVRGLRGLDVGASTGGFTDCLLQAGAAHVIAVDVGYGQLAWSLQTDPRVTSIERKNARELEPGDLPYRAEVVVADVSFISLTLVLPAIRACAAPGAPVILLVKPQFEAGREAVGKGGVVRDPEARRASVEKVRAAARGLGFSEIGETQSPIPGPAGNIEHLLALRAPAQSD
jgi:23S rRNA (cytidine1920-2'-O)/16S rRNA (cytidine1409-2'-O)-methyltransferase